MPRNRVEGKVGQRYIRLRLVLTPRLKTSPVHFSARQQQETRSLASTIATVAAARSLTLMSCSMTGNAVGVTRRRADFSSGASTRKSHELFRVQVPDVGG